jgi:hypothetical protein
MEQGNIFTSGQRTAVAWKNEKIIIRIPWTMLYFYDPTQMQIIDGAVSHDGGYNMKYRQQCQMVLRYRYTSTEGDLLIKQIYMASMACCPITVAAEKKSLRL